MNTPLHRLYRTKLTLLAIAFVAGGILLLVLAQVASSWPGWEWLASWPAQIGSGLFTTGLIVVAFEYIDREDGEERAMYRLRTIFKEQAPALRNSMLETFAIDADTLAKVASEDTLDGMVRNSLAIQLGDKQLAHDVYEDLREQVLRSTERWRDVQVSVDLAPWSGGPASGSGSMFEATVRWEYRVVPSSPVMRFACVSDLDDYRQLLLDPTSTLVWHFEPVGELQGGSAESFELLQFSVDGKPRPMKRSRRVRAQTYVVDVASPLNASEEHRQREVVISYTYRVLVQRHSHVLQLDIAKPAKGLKVQFAYGGCGIRHVNVLDFIASATQPRISRSAAGSIKPVVEVGFDGWVWPKSGVAMGWVLEEEMLAQADKRSTVGSNA